MENLNVPERYFRPRWRLILRNLVWGCSHTNVPKMLVRDAPSHWLWRSSNVLKRIPSKVQGFIELRCVILCSTDSDQSQRYRYGSCNSPTEKWEGRVFEWCNQNLIIILKFEPWKRILASRWYTSIGRCRTYRRWGWRDVSSKPWKTLDKGSGTTKTALSVLKQRRRYKGYTGYPSDNHTRRTSSSVRRCRGIIHSSTWRYEGWKF